MSNSFNRYLEEYAARRVPGAPFVRGATVKSITISRILAEASRGLPPEMIAIMAGVDSVTMRLLLKGALTEEEMTHDLLQKVAELLDVDMKELE